MKNKRPASMLISAILASVMFIIIANSFMNLWGNSFTTLTAAKTATEAQNLSDIVSEKLKLEGVDAEEVTTKTPLSDITGNDDDDDWLYTYEIGNEFEDDDGNIFKVAEVKIYKDGEDNPRYSTEIPLSSSGNSDGLEVGMVVAWTLSSNPSDNYLECNGQGVDKNKYPKLYQLMHNVPDYRGVFLRGLGGNSAALGILQNDAIRNITGSFMVAGNGNDHGLGQPQSGAFYQTWRASGSEWGNNGTPYYMTYFDASRVVPAAEENRPVNKSVRYFMKAK